MFIQTTDVKNYNPPAPVHHTLSDGRELMLHPVPPSDFLDVLDEVKGEDGKPNKGAMMVAMIRLAAHDHEGTRLFGCSEQVLGTITRLEDIATTAAKVAELCGLTDDSKKNLTDGDSLPSG